MILCENQVFKSASQRKRNLKNRLFSLKAKPLKLLKFQGSNGGEHGTRTREAIALLAFQASSLAARSTLHGQPAYINIGVLVFQQKTPLISNQIHLNHIFVRTIILITSLYAANTTPAIGHTIHVISHRMLMKLQTR